MMLLADDWGVGEVLWSLMWFFLFVLWIMLVFRIFADIFRSEDMGGLSKTLWTIFVIFVPFLGVFVYLIARGGRMATNEIQAAKQQEAATQAYIRNVAGSSGGPSAAEELARLADLRDRGVIDENEFATLKAKALS
jgi:Phospholipase_D-nuclease N-terminal/Short C-terminal domain